jgi:histone deacetylase complex regulatory component SIN3
MGESLDDFGNDDVFYVQTKHMIHERNNYLDLIKIINFYAKEILKRMRRKSKTGIKIFAKLTSDKGLLSKLHKEFLTEH